MDERAGDGPPDLGAWYQDAPCGLLATNPDGLIQHVNRTFCLWIGRDPTELVGRKRLQDLLTMGGRIFHQTHWGPLIQIQGSVSEVKLELLHADGRRLPTVWNIVRCVRKGVTTHEIAVFIAEDRHQYEQELLAERRRVEALLAQEQQTQRALLDAQADRDRQQALAEDRALFAEQMMAIVSHDLRNPLAVIQMSARLLASSGLSGPQEAVLARLASSTSRANRLIADLLDFSRGRLGSGLQIELTDLELHAVVAEALDDLRLAAPGRRIEQRSRGNGPCSGNKDRLTQLVGNLVANALAYGLRDRPVIVTSTVEKDVYSISVQNEGTPIDFALLPRLFDPMTRGMPTAGDANSVGLGLFIVREIARAHGGTVSVASLPETGTLFTAVFPRRTPATGNPETAPPAP